MKTKITFIIDREPIELSPSGDLADAEKLVKDDPSYLMWVLEKEFEVNIEAVN